MGNVLRYILAVAFTLTLQYTTVTNLAMVDWNPQSSTADGLVNPDAGTGGGVMSAEYLYSGHIVIITAVGLTNGGVKIQTSLDLVNWHWWPADGSPVLTLLPTNNIAILVPDISPRYFRGVWFQPSF